MKYIITKNETDPEAVYVFPAIVSHDDFAIMVGGTVIAAGFVKMEATKIICYGNSNSLNVNSRPIDGETIKEHLNFL